MRLLYILHRYNGENEVGGLRLWNGLVSVADSVDTTPTWVLATNYFLYSSDPAVYELHSRVVDSFNTIYHNIITSKLLFHLPVRVASAAITRPVIPMATCVAKSFRISQTRRFCSITCC